MKSISNAFECYLYQKNNFRLMLNFKYLLASDKKSKCEIKKIYLISLYRLKS